jgi:hypothetical protein
LGRVSSMRHCSSYRVRHRQAQLRRQKRWRMLGAAHCLRPPWERRVSLQLLAVPRTVTRGVAMHRVSHACARRTDSVVPWDGTPSVRTTQRRLVSRRANARNLRPRTRRGRHLRPEAPVVLATAARGAMMQRASPVCAPLTATAATTFGTACVPLTLRYSARQVVCARRQCLPIPPRQRPPRPQALPGHLPHQHRAQHPAATVAPSMPAQIAATAPAQRVCARQMASAATHFGISPARIGPRGRATPTATAPRRRPP